jgi:hypothetical protein
LLKSIGQPKLGGTTDARAFVPFGMNALFYFIPLTSTHPAPLQQGNKKEKKMEMMNETGEIKQVEYARMQEQTSLPVEDRSLPAEQVLIQQAEQDNRPSLFVP